MVISLKNKIVALVLAVILSFSVPVLGFAGEKETGRDFKIIGYYSGDLFNEPVEKLQTDKLTHIMYAFLIPNEDGTVKPLNKPAQLAEVVSKAHGDGCKVYIALGGWSYEGVPLAATFEKVAADNTLRSKLTDSVVQFTLDNNLDGVEIDWEHPNAGTIGSYEKLVVELSKALKAKGKSLTAAVNGAWSTTAGPEVSKLMTDTCLNAFEFINVMGYDMNNEEHSPLWFGNTSINYWLNRGVPADHIVLGMPLYARPSWMQYRSLVEQDEANAYKDYAATSPNVSYYNGLSTLREKTSIALKKAGGVMFFDVNEDVDWRDAKLGKYSAVSEVYRTVKSAQGFSRAEMQNYVTVVLDNQVMDFSKAVGLGTPFLDENHRTMVPMRKLLETIGAEIIWDNAARSVTAVKTFPATNEYPAGKNVTVKAAIGDNFITVNGNRVNLDTETVIKDGRTYLPARAVLEAFGYSLSWKDASSTVYIESK
ncbi:glycosyl hydrolase family 18 protein [Aminipila luticellarii]|uniref:GH18 domain-containing protein n=1 Tax=Aminipila luticellarii TaxID=2507160 RepID=A0A410PUM5_9FIRM|nr:glycosyl hydrolase family 18 protein [Aminipila luticellarii]QAT42625.1 hypothetical protein EQM06_04960 [Aminipila luticellarii]